LLSYQWFFNQTNALAGATNTILVVTNAQPANVGTYSVWVTNVAGAVVSSNAWLTVLMPPTITGQPTNLTVVAGATASFQVIANGSGLLSYQWLFNQTSVLMGATNASLTLAGAQTAAAGGYSVVVTNSAGAVTSVVAALTVFGPPSIVMQPTNLTVVAGATAGFQVTANGSGPLSYQWFFNQTNALAGATNTMLVVSNAQPANGGAYSVVVTNVAGSVPSSAATLTIISPPSIAQQPVSITTNQGAQVVFSIAATGSLPLTYQWWFNGATALPSATSATLVLPSVQMSQAGSYSATVMNAAGTVKSEAANLVVVGGALAVALTAPAAYSNYCAGSDVQLTALVTTNQYSIASVDFYAGGTHLGASLSAPYRFDWASPQDGSYTLSARVTDVLGNTAVSPPVGITVTPQCQPVAIVRAAADPEIDAMRDYLLEMGFGSQVFDQAGLTAGQLQSFKLVIWDDVGAPANTLSANTVDALAQLYANGMPLYLIGDHLVSADLRLPQPQQTEWAGLTHLSGPGDLTGNNTIFIVNNEGSSNPVLWGEFFTVTNFAYPLPVEMAVNDSASEMYAESAGACVLAGYPSMSSGAFQTPILTQNLRVLPLDAGASTNDLRGLFQNAVCWLTGCRCQDADLGLDVGPVTNVVVVGQLLSYGLIASSGLVGSSECAPLGVTVTNPLPSGFEFIGASAEQGSWAYDPLQRQVVFYIGLMPKVGTVDLAVTVMPTQFGTFTNQPVIRLSQGGTAGEKLSWLDPPMVITVIAGTNSAPARLRARLLAPSALQLSLSGRSGVLYNVQSSPDLSHWAGFTNVLGPVWTQEIPLSPGTNSSRRFYRAVDP